MSKHDSSISLLSFGFLLSPSSFPNQDCGNVLYVFISLAASVLFSRSQGSERASPPNSHVCSSLLLTTLPQHSVLVFWAECAGSLVLCYFFSQGSNGVQSFLRHHTISMFCIPQAFVTLCLTKAFFFRALPITYYPHIIMYLPSCIFPAAVDYSPL